MRAPPAAVFLCREHSLKARKASPPGARPARRSPAQRAGAEAEARACNYLRARGLRILARNVRYRAGEIDAIALDGDTWVFIEVRSRSRTGDAAASVDARKQCKIRRAAQLYLLNRFGDRWPPCRFDVVLVECGRIEWLAAAFNGDEDP